MTKEEWNGSWDAAIEEGRRREIEHQKTKTVYNPPKYIKKAARRFGGFRNYIRQSPLGTWISFTKLWTIRHNKSLVFKISKMRKR